MSNYNQQLDALSLQTNQAITVKNTTDSIDPVDVGGSITALIEFLKNPLGKINEFDILTGTAPPVQSQGVEDDVYIQGGTSLTFWKKDNNAWVNKGNVPLGISIVDGNINVQSSINGLIVTASAGQWAINNVIYQKATQTQYTLDPVDANFDRIDALFADTSNVVNYEPGVASSTPDNTKPTTPANEIIITYIYVPSAASGQSPYIVDGNTSAGGSGVPATSFGKTFQINDLSIIDYTIDLSADTNIPVDVYPECSVWVNGVPNGQALFNPITRILSGLPDTNAGDTVIVTAIWSNQILLP